MSVRFHMSSQVQLSAQRLFELMVDVHAQQEYQYLRGALEVRCQRRQEADRVTLEIYVKEPSHEAADKPPDEGTMIMHYHPAALDCTWERKDHKHGKLVSATGRIRILPGSESRCTLDEEGEIAIRIPILGNRIAKKAAAELEKNHALRCRQWEELAAKLG